MDAKFVEILEDHKPESNLINCINRYTQSEVPWVAFSRINRIRNLAGPLTMNSEVSLIRHSGVAAL